MKAQFLSGYILSTVRNILSTYNSNVDLDSLLSHLTAFDIEYNFNSGHIADPIFTVCENIISRGLPTLPSIFIEESISSTFEIAEQVSDENRLSSIVFKPTKKIQSLRKQIYKSFFLVDSRISKLDSINQFYESPTSHQLNENELFFITNTLPKNFGTAFSQLAETQREISTISNHRTKRKISYDASNGSSEGVFFAQRLDFSFELPSASGYSSSLAIEIDGPQHREPAQQRLDHLRDEFLKEVGWNPTLRLKTNELEALPIEKEQVLTRFLSHPYCTQVADNHEAPLWENQEGLEALQIALTPLGIARIQRSFLFLIQNGILKLTDDKWTIAVIERDVPCAHLALADLKHMLEQLFILENCKRKLPSIQLTVFHTKEFESCKLNAEVNTIPIEAFNPSIGYDAILDVSILQRSGFSFPQNIAIPNNERLLRIRSAYSPRTKRKVNSAKPIKYSFPKEDQPEPLVFFLQNIFRKKKFLEGQVNILRRTLALDSVIALLPTGAGKSLTYQLSALLQPGITLVVDPIKALMRDQDQNLRNTCIDSTTFINSSISAEERNVRSQDMVEGRYQFVFVSPERLQIQEFRDYLGKMSDTYFAYCVIDEAHCVSEWGHDFRTAYLRLGENVRKYCRVHPKSLKEIPLIGLTGTASYDVLSDVQRELFVKDNFAIVSPSKYEREELIFKIENISNIFQSGRTNEKQFREAVAKAKKQKLKEIITDLPYHDWSDELQYTSVGDFFSRETSSPNSGIIFCPHVNWVFGVTDVASNIKSTFPELSTLTDTYAGSLADSDGTVNLEQTQENFKEDKLGLLVATKAFGMGIDKPNIRFTIHLSMPQSIESFYQEAGRAGRDRHKAYCYILHSTDLLYRNGSQPLTVDKDLMLTFFHNSFPGQAKEELVIWDLLDEITYSSLSINEKVKLEDLDIEVPINLKVWNNLRVYVNGNYPGSYGYINIQGCQIFPETSPNKMIVSQTESQNILQLIVDQIYANCPPGNDISKWIVEEEKIPPQPGLEKIIRSLEKGVSAVVIVPFSNDMLSDIAQYLHSNDIRIEESEVKKSYRYCFSSEEFLGRLFGARRVAPQIRETVTKMFLKVRGEQDTFRAIYRLTIIGAVDDYVVDYKTKTITTYVSKKEDQEYLDNLANFIGRYDSPENKEKVYSNIVNTKGDTMIRKCCSYLTDFVYRKIAAKRQEAINVMEFALNSTNFNEYVNTYFDSRYTPHFRPHLYNNSIDWIWEFLRENATDQDSISNIRGACDRLLVENPSNPSFLLLRSYSKFTNPNYDKNEALDDFHKSWLLLKTISNRSDADFLSFLTKFYKQIIVYDKELGVYLNKAFLNYHLAWLTSFIPKFLEEN